MAATSTIEMAFVPSASVGHPEHAIVADVEQFAVGGERRLVRETSHLDEAELTAILAVKPDCSRDLFDHRKIRRSGCSQVRGERCEQKKSFGPQKHN